MTIFGINAPTSPIKEDEEVKILTQSPKQLVPKDSKVDAKSKSEDMTKKESYHNDKLDACENINLRQKEYSKNCYVIG